MRKTGGRGDRGQGTGDRGQEFRSSGVQEFRSQEFRSQESDIRSQEEILVGWITVDRPRNSRFAKSLISDSELLLCNSEVALRQLLLKFSRASARWDASLKRGVRRVRVSCQIFTRARPSGASLKQRGPVCASFFQNLHALARGVLLTPDFRVEPAVADWLPHSPVRAQLRHTVLQARISLRR
jgi:hypothetical protein